MEVSRQKQAFQRAELDGSAALARNLPERTKQLIVTPLPNRRVCRSRHFPLFLLIEAGTSPALPFSCFRCVKGSEHYY